MTTIDTDCPWCGKETESYFDYTEEADWTVTTPRRHDQHSECRRGCTEITETTDLYFNCEHCRGELNAHCTYAQPCNANGYIIAMTIHRSE